MHRALVIYNSKTGTTERFGKEIADFLSSRGVQANAVSIFKYDPQDLEGVEYVLLGCWTSGLMVAFQRPERTWREFAASLPDLSDRKIGLFTTYTLATGSMFNGMKKHVRMNPDEITLELKSRDGRLNDGHKQQLMTFLQKGEHR